MPQHVPNSLPPVAPKGRGPFATRSLWWLVFFDAAWGVEEVVMNVAAVFLTPLCFVGTAVPVYFIQKNTGDRTRVAASKAFFFGFLAALPFPVTGTVFGSLMLALSRLRPNL